MDKRNWSMQGSTVAGLMFVWIVTATAQQNVDGNQTRPYGMKSNYPAYVVPSGSNSNQGGQLPQPSGMRRTNAQQNHSNTSERSRPYGMRSPYPSYVVPSKANSNQRSPAELKDVIAPARNTSTNGLQSNVTAPTRMSPTTRVPDTHSMLDASAERLNAESFEKKQGGQHTQENLSHSLPRIEASKNPYYRYDRKGNVTECTTEPSPKKADPYQTKLKAYDTYQKSLDAGDAATSLGPEMQRRNAEEMLRIQREAGSRVPQRTNRR